MFVPNNKCRLQVTSGETDVYGQPKPGRWVTEGCSILKLLIVAGHTSLRPSQSASQGAATELQSTARLLLTPRSQADIDDIVELQGYQFKIDSKEPRFDASGRLDHYEIAATAWRKS